MTSALLAESNDRAVVVETKNEAVPHPGDTLQTSFPTSFLADAPEAWDEWSSETPEWAELRKLFDVER